MRHLRLKKGLSYTGPGIQATKAQPDVFLEDDAAADAAIATGYFMEVAGADVVLPPPAPTGTIEAIDTMGAVKLRAYAKKNGLTLTWPAGTPADTIREDIRAALKEPGDENDPPEELFEGNPGEAPGEGSGEGPGEAPE